MKVELADEARAQAAAIDSWWRQHRDASDLFLAELGQMLGALETTKLGTKYRGRAGVRRVLLPRTRYHVYWIEERDVITVIAIWSAHRGRGPKL